MFLLPTLCGDVTIFNVAPLDIVIVLLFIAVDRQRTDSFSCGDFVDIFFDLSSLSFVVTTYYIQQMLHKVIISSITCFM